MSNRELFPGANSGYEQNKMPKQLATKSIFATQQKQSSSPRASPSMFRQTGQMTTFSQAPSRIETSRSQNTYQSKQSASPHEMARGTMYHSIKRSAEESGGPQYQGATKARHDQINHRRVEEKQAYRQEIHHGSQGKPSYNSYSEPIAPPPSQSQNVTLLRKDYSQAHQVMDHKNSNEFVEFEDDFSDEIFASMPEVGLCIDSDVEAQEHKDQNKVNYQDFNEERPLKDEHSEEDAQDEAQEGQGVIASQCSESNEGGQFIKPDVGTKSEVYTIKEEEHEYGSGGKVQLLKELVKETIDMNYKMAEMIKKVVGFTGEDLYKTLGFSDNRACQHQCSKSCRSPSSS